MPSFSNLLPNVVRMMEASAVLKAQLISSGNKSFAFSFNNFFFIISHITGLKILLHDFHTEIHNINSDVACLLLHGLFHTSI